MKEKKVSHYTFETEVEYQYYDKVDGLFRSTKTVFPSMVSTLESATRILRRDVDESAYVVALTIYKVKRVADMERFEDISEVESIKEVKRI